MLNTKYLDDLIERFHKQTTLGDWMKYAWELREALMYWRREKQLEERPDRK